MMSHEASAALGGLAATAAAAAEGGGDVRPPASRFLVVLRGSAVLTYTPPSDAPASDDPDAPPDAARVPSSMPIHRLRVNDHFGAINVLMGHEASGSKELQLYAGAEGCTLLSWTGDE